MKQLVSSTVILWTFWRNREKVDFSNAVGLLHVSFVTAVNSRFRSLRGYRSVYLCFSTSHAALHPAHTQKSTGRGAAQEAGICLYGLSDLAKVVILRREDREEERGGGGGL